MNSNNWERFWHVHSRSRFTQVSWSKQRIISVLERFIKAGFSVLDAGCGSGFFSRYFIDKGCVVTSLDHSEEALIIAKRLTEGRANEYLHANLLDADLARSHQRKFHLIFSDGLLEHFGAQDQQRIIANLFQMKREKGFIVTFVPNRYSWWQLVRPWAMPGIEEVPFTTQRLIDLHSGMRVIEKGGVGVLPVKFSPEKTLGSQYGMLLYCIAC